MLYEVIRDTAKINSFAGIDLMHYDGYYEGENISIARLTYQNSNTKKFAVVNLSLQGFAGKYKVSGIDGLYTQDSIYDGNKFGFGGRVSLIGGVNINIKGFRLGLGIEPSIGLDFGRFYSFRDLAERKGVINNEDNFLTFYLNIFPYLSLPIGKSSLISLQANLGMPGFLSPSLTFQMDNYVFWTSYAIERINFGVMINYDSFKKRF